MAVNIDTILQGKAVKIRHGRATVTGDEHSFDHWETGKVNARTNRESGNLGIRSAKLPGQCLHANKLQEVFMFRKLFPKNSPKNGRFLLLLLVVSLLFFSGFVFSQGQYENTARGITAGSVETSKNYPMEVVDDLGNKVVLKSKPVRILSGTLMTDEILLSLVDKSRIIGVTTLSDDPGISNVAGETFGIPNRVTLNVEKFISLSPDIVFLASWSNASKVKQLREAGLQVFQVNSPLTVAAVEKVIKEVAHVVGEDKKGNQLVNWMEEKLSYVKERVSGIPEDKRLTVMDYGTWGSSFGKGSSWDNIVKLAGLINAVGNLKADRWGNVPISKEKLIELDPDILILPAWVWGDPAGADKFFKNVITDPALQELKAVKNNRVYRIPEKYKASTSQYIVYAVVELARLAYPKRFKR